MTSLELAPPPISRKLAGEPPCSFMMSIVAIAKPAPFVDETKRKLVFLNKILSYTLGILILKDCKINSDRTKHPEPATIIK